MEKRTVFLVENHPLMRRGLGSLIDGEHDLVVCGEAATRREALLAVTRRPPDLVIVDLMLKDGDDGLELIKTLKIQHPTIRTLVFSMHPDAVYAERALRAGAHGYLNKQQRDETVLAAIRRVLDGCIYVSEALGMTLAAHLVGRAKSSPSPLAALSDRELQVFRLIGEWRPAREIAQILHLSPKTIESHRERLKHKLGLNTGTELLRRATGFVETGDRQ